MLISFHGLGTCAFHSTLASTETHYKMEAAGDEPSRKFTIELCVDDMERLYKIFSGEELGCEISNKNKGRSRVEYALMILKEQGVLGRGRKSAEKVGSTRVLFIMFHALLLDSTFAPNVSIDFFESLTLTHI